MIKKKTILNILSRNLCLNSNFLSINLFIMRKSQYEVGGSLDRNIYLCLDTGIYSFLALNEHKYDWLRISFSGKKTFNVLINNKSYQIKSFLFDI